jgi:hypothetical protein
MNQAGIKAIHDLSRPLAVDSMDRAAEVIAKEIARGPSPSTTPESWARHIAWVIGFDALIEDREKVRAITQYQVEA